MGKSCGNVSWSNEEIERLQEFYEENEALYNVRIKEYSDRNVRAGILDDIGQQLGKTGETCVC